MDSLLAPKRAAARRVAEKDTITMEPRLRAHDALLPVSLAEAQRRRLWVVCVFVRNRRSRMARMG